MPGLAVAQTRETAEMVVPWSALTDREHQVLDGIVAGLSNPELATELFVSVNTIKFHVANLLRKLNVRSRIDAAVIAAVDSEGRREGRPNAANAANGAGREATPATVPAAAESPS